MCPHFNFVKNNLQSWLWSGCGLWCCPEVSSAREREMVCQGGSLGQCWSEWRRWRTPRSSSTHPGATRLLRLRLRRTASRRAGGRDTTQVSSDLLRYHSHCLISHISYLISYILYLISHPNSISHYCLNVSYLRSQSLS